MNIIELAKKTTVNLLNAASTSRHTTPEAVANEMNTILEGDEQITSDVIKAFVKSGLLNTKGVLEFKLTKGRYGGIREVDFNNKTTTTTTTTAKEKSEPVEATAEVKAETKAEVEAPAKKRTKRQLRAWRRENIAKARDARLAKLQAKKAEIQPSASV